MTKEITPVCEISGLPLPILPPGPRENGAFLYPNVIDPQGPNEHHPWHNERAVKDIPFGGEALQNSRIQIIDWYYHKNYHDMFEGPILPADEDRLFRFLVTGVAGVIPLQALDVSRKGEFSVVDLTKNQQIQIASKIRVDQNKPVARFLAEYATKQEVSSVVDEIKIEQFLDKRTDGEKKREIASLLLGGAIGLSLENAGLYDHQKDLKDQGLFAKPRPRTLYWVAKHLVRLKHLEYFSSRLEDSLSAT